MAATDGQRVISIVSASRVTLSELCIDGGGQTEDKFTGIRAAIGVYIDDVSHFNICRIQIRNCGVVNRSHPTSDGGYGGFGILLSPKVGEITRGSISGCSISNIAGGGNYAGDGIYIGGGEAYALTTQRVVVTDCNIINVGRHCYTVTTGPNPASSPRSILIKNCTGKAAALSGVDIEGGAGISVWGCAFSNCGTSIYYVNAIESFGSDYRLCAGVATTNGDRDISISNCYISNSYYGITYGAVEGLVITKSCIELSERSDLSMLLAAGPSRARLDQVSCLTAKDIFLTYAPSINDMVIKNCHFVGAVLISTVAGAVFQHCAFDLGVRFAGRGIRNVTFFGCQFSNLYGPGIGFSVAGLQSTGCRIVQSTFQGAGKMTHGIHFLSASAKGWTVEQSTFSKIVMSAIGSPETEVESEILALQKCSIEF